MNTKEYDRRKNGLISEYESAKFALAKEFAISNNKFRIGDTVTDGRVRIKIEKGKISTFGSSYPYCIWEGPKLTKKGVPRKDEEIGYIQDSNII